MNVIDHPVILFDGVCNLCNSSVKFLIQIDKERKLRYAQLQSEIGEKLLDRFQLDKNRLESIVLIDDKHIFTKSTAILQIAKHLGGLWKYFSYLSFIPAWFRDFFYDLITENRYWFFGKRKECMIPDEKFKGLFLS